MKKLLLLLLCVPLIGLGQVPEWARTFYGVGDIGDEKIESVKISKNGDVYIAGYFDNHITFDDSVFYNGITGSGVRERSGFISRIDSSGNVVWANYFGGNETEEIIDIIIDQNNDIVVLFNTNSNTIYFNDGSQINTNNRDVVLSKYNSSGLRLWSSNIGDNINKKGYSLVSDELDNIYITGYYGKQNTSFQDSLMLCKFSSNGTYLWLNTYGSDAMQGKSIVYHNGILTVTGNFVYSLTMGGVTFNNSSISDVFVCTFDTSGVISNVNAFHNNTSMEAFDIDIIGDDYYLVGRHHDDIYFSNDTLYSQGYQSGFVMCIDNNLVHKWSKTIYSSGNGAVTVSKISTNNDNEVFITGGINSDTLMIDTIPLFYSISSDGFLIKLDKDGTFYFANQIGDAVNGGTDGIGGLDELDGTIYLGGIYGPYSLYIGNDTLVHNYLQNNQSYKETFLIKYQDTTNITITSIENNYYNNVSKKLINVVDILGRKTTPTSNVLLFYIYNDGTVEKKMIIE